MVVDVDVDVEVVVSVTSAVAVDGVVTSRRCSVSGAPTVIMTVEVEVEVEVEVVVIVVGGKVVTKVTSNAETEVALNVETEVVLNVEDGEAAVGVTAKYGLSGRGVKGSRRTRPCPAARVEEAFNVEGNSLAATTSLR